MSSSYQLCPALKLDDGYLVVRRVEKAYPVFLRCAAAYLPPSGPVLAEALDNIEVFPTLAEFSAAAARLVSQPMLQPFDGGVTVLVYVARPGKESLFLEFAEGLDQADDYRLLRTLPAVGAPLALVFGDPSVPLGEPSRAMPAAYASVDTAIGLKAISVIDQPPIVLPAADSPMPMDEAPAPLPDLSAILPDIPRPPLPLGDPLPPEYSSAFMAPDLQPLPPPEATGPAPLLDNEALPPMDVVMVTTSALDDVLGSSMAERGNAERPAGEPEALAYADPSEPALETLLRQAPRLQSPDTGPTPPASGRFRQSSATTRFVRRSGSPRWDS